MEEKLKIKIISCPNPNYWYASHIGETFEAAPQTKQYSGHEVYVVDLTQIETIHAGTGFISVQCAKIIKEKSQKVKGENDG